MDQLKPRHISEEENDPVIDITDMLDQYNKTDYITPVANEPVNATQTTQPTMQDELSHLLEYGRHNLRRSKRTRRRPQPLF